MSFFKAHVIASINIFFRTYISNQGKTLRLMGDPCSTVKLSEFFSDCYAEQYDAYHVNSNTAVYKNSSLNFGPVRHYRHFRTSFSQSNRDYPAVAISPFFLYIVPYFFNGD